MNKLIAMAALALTACTSTLQVDEPQYLTPRELNSNPDVYDAREVDVRGFVLLGSNARSLHQSRADFRRFRRGLKANRPDFNPADFDDDCLTLLNAEALLDNREIFAGETITVRGVFERNYLDGTVVDLQACGGPSALILDDESVQTALDLLR